MTKLILTAAIALGSLAATAAPAKADFFFSRHRHHDGPSVSVSFGSPRTVYVVERGVPVRRSYYYDHGRYFRVVSGRRVYVTDRVYTSYPREYRHHYSHGHRHHHH
jgi:hypothetical protein